MKVLTITEKNINEVYGRVRKFFYNKNRTGFEEWHNFDCGFKKHISRYIRTEDGEKIKICNRYPSPDNVELIKECEWKLKTFIRINLMPGYGFIMKPGDKIAFLGNRIIFRSEFIIDSHNLQYSVFQVVPMSDEKQHQMKSFAEHQEKLYEESYYDDFEW